MTDITRFRPTPADKFTFGLWTVGNRGRDPFGDFVRPTLDPVRIVHRLAELGAWGVNLHDNDLVPIEATPAERDHIVGEFRRALDATRMVVPMATTNLFWDPIFKDGAFTSNDRAVRALCAAEDDGRHRSRCGAGGAHLRVLGRTRGRGNGCGEGSGRSDKRFREAIDFLCEYVRDRHYDLRFALEAKPNEPRGDIYFPTTSAYLAFIPTLAHPEMVGVNPEVAHEQMAGLNVLHAVAQAIEAGKLFHIDLNDQKPGRFDQDLRFGSESIKSMFFLVKLLEESGYDGPRHFDAHAYRTEDEEGVWDFAAGCMRTYLILKHKAKAFAAHREIQALLAEMRDAGAGEPIMAYTSERAKALRGEAFDRAALTARRLPYERLDQLVVELLLGV